MSEATVRGKLPGEFSISAFHLIARISWIAAAPASRTLGTSLPVPRDRVAGRLLVLADGDTHVADPANDHGIDPIYRGGARLSSRRGCQLLAPSGAECPVLVSCASCAPFAREAPDFLETESGVQMQCGSVIPAHIEDVAGASEGPTQPGLGQRRGDTPAPPRRLHQNVPPQETRNKSSRVMTGRRFCVTVTDAKGGRSSLRSRYASDVRDRLFL